MAGDKMKHLSGEEVSRLLDGELPRTEAKRAMAHLRVCPTCRLLAEDTQLAAGALLSCRMAADEPLADTQECPDEGIVLAYADGSIRDDEERSLLAAHIAACRRCSHLAGGASAFKRISEQIRRTRPEHIPPHVEERVRERYFSRPAFVGQIIARIRDLLGQTGHWVEFNIMPELGDVMDYPIPMASARSLCIRQSEKAIDRKCSGLMESGIEEYSARIPPIEPHLERPSDRARRLAARFHEHPSAPIVPHPSQEEPTRLEGLGVKMRFRAQVDGGIYGTVSVLGPSGNPQSGITVELQKAGKRISESRTDDKGVASFVGISRGRYRVLLRHGRGAYFEFQLV